MFHGPNIGNDTTVQRIIKTNFRRYANEIKHHEEGEAFQEQFKLDVERLKVTMNEYGNPFSEYSIDTLVVLHNGNLKRGKSVENLSKIEEVGDKAYKAFVKEVSGKNSIDFRDYTNEQSFHVQHRNQSREETATSGLLKE